MNFYFKSVNISQKATNKNVVVLCTLHTWPRVTLLTDEESAWGKHVLGCNFAKYSPTGKTAYNQFAANLPGNLTVSVVLLKMEVGIRKRAWQRDWRYPAYLWSLRWVYAVKRTREVGIRRIPAYTPPNTPLLTVKKIVNRLRFDRTMVISSRPHFLRHPAVAIDTCDK